MSLSKGTGVEWDSIKGSSNYHERLKPKDWGITKFLENNNEKLKEDPTTREKTFKLCHWNEHEPKPDMTEMVGVGFYHSGRGDKTICIHCGLKMQHWKQEEKPDVAHEEIRPCVKN